jgi:hypothetical protein
VFLGARYSTGPLRFQTNHKGVTVRGLVYEVAKQQKKFTKLMAGPGVSKCWHICNLEYKVHRILKLNEILEMYLSNLPSNMEFLLYQPG